MKEEESAITAAAWVGVTEGIEGTVHTLHAATFSTFMRTLHRGLPINEGFVWVEWERVCNCIAALISGEKR